MADNTQSTGSTAAQSSSQSSSQSGSQPAPRPAPPQVRSGPGHMTEVAALSSDKGRTSIADSVVAKISGIATREVPGVYALGGGVSRAFAAMRQRVPGGKPNVAQGVSVEVGEKQCAVDLNVIVEYGVSIADLAASIRDNVIDSVERMTGLQVVEVNISVDDIHIPSDDSDQEPSRRVE